jgi:hypothetical protein
MIGGASCTLMSRKHPTSAGITQQLREAFPFETSSQIERHLKRLLSEYVRYHRSDSEGCTTVTIKGPAESRSELCRSLRSFATTEQLSGSLENLSAANKTSPNTRSEGALGGRRLGIRLLQDYGEKDFSTRSTIFLASATASRSQLKSYAPVISSLAYNLGICSPDTCMGYGASPQRASCDDGTCRGRTRMVVLCDPD